MTFLIPSKAAQALLASCVAASSLSFASLACAEEDSLPLRVVVSNGDAPTCADAAGFIEAVHAVEPKARLSDAASAPLAGVVYRVRPGGGYHGELRFESGDDAALPRTAEGNDCADVTRALAMVAAFQASAVRPVGRAPVPEAATPQAPTRDEAAMAPSGPIKPRISSTDISSQSFDLGSCSPSADST